MSLPSFYDCDFILYVPSFHLYVPINARLANLRPFLASKFYASWKQRKQCCVILSLHFRWPLLWPMPEISSGEWCYLLGQGHCCPPPPPFGSVSSASFPLQMTSTVSSVDKGIYRMRIPGGFYDKAIKELMRLVSQILSWG